MESLTHAEAAALVSAHDLIGIGMRADEVRRGLHGAATTFVRVFEIHVDAPPASPPAGLSAGELRIVGRPASLDAAVAAVRAAVAIAGGTPVTGFALADLVALDTGQGPERACRALGDAGLAGVAEVAIDTPADPALVSAARAAGLAVTRLTVHALADEGRVEIVERARDLQAAVGGFQVFAPLPRVIEVSRPSTGYDDVKLVALARLLCPNIDSIQVDWPLYGPKLAQVALTVGANDVDGVAAVDPGTLGTRRSPIEEIRGNIRAAGLEPVERNARFERLA